MLRTFAWERSGLRLASCCTAPSTRYQRLLHTSSPFFSSALEEVKAKERSVDPLPKRAKMKMEPYVKNLFRGIIDPNVFAFGELDLGSLNVLKVMKEETEKFMNAEASLLSSPEVKISAETVSKLKDLGVFKLNIPQEYGGLEATLTEITYLMEIFSRNPSLFQTLNVHLHYVSCLFSKFASDEQKSKYLPALASGDLQVGLAAWEDEAGTDLSNIKCHSTFTGSKYILSGTKKWVCNGGLADKLVVFARDGFGGSVGSVSCFLVDKNSEGVSAKSMDTLGLNSYNAWEVTFDKTSVPKENLVGEVGQGLDMFTSIFFGKFSLAASYIGILRDLVTTTITHAINRETFKKPLIQHDLVKQRISEVTCSLYALESVAYLTTDLFDNIEDPDLEVEMAIVKLYSCETMISVVQKCLSILGSDSYLKDKPYARILQDALFYPMVDTSVDTQRMTIALLCLQHVGKFFQGSVMQRRNPLFFPQKTLVDYFRKTLKLGEEVKGYKALIHEHCHPCFELVSETLEKTIMKFQLVVEETLVKWGSEIDHQQMNLARFADIAVDLYVCTAVLGRATRSISIGLRNCDTDGFIANTIILESCDRISRNFEELDKSPYQNSDANHISIVDTLLHERKYYAPHPLERNW